MSSAQLSGIGFDWYGRNSLPAFWQVSWKSVAIARKISVNLVTHWYNGVGGEGFNSNRLPEDHKGEKSFGEGRRE